MRHFLHVGIVFYLPSDVGFWAVSCEYASLWGKGEEAVADAVDFLHHVSSWKVGTPHAAAKEGVAREEAVIAFYPETYAARGVARGVDDTDADCAQEDFLSVEEAFPDDGELSLDGKADELVCHHGHRFIDGQVFAVAHGCQIVFFCKGGQAIDVVEMRMCLQEIT